ncbi:hypothetical protein C2E20_7167 [Micractinium conductrix]|uniref:VASt domain-containing protein n=1 Tax=Micractinium conductrix TaxID=554055 RepID=A0A2P6V5F9_9CHLO|nr:hypothetical protein C2E20_7167 [Micractinium conductrix]|eukprot:PSC69312.1 hypothetical protein C2E20_7167 [Micractinium conductrix]
MAAATDGELEARWPRWPDGEEGLVALDVVLGLPVDQAFLLLYGGLTDMRKAFNEVAGDREYSTTDWVEGAAAVQAAAVGPTPPPLASVAGLRVGMLRRASYSGSMMGSKFRNEELHRLMEASPGASYTVMTTVLTTAMHGEKFRPVVVTTLRALPDGRTQLRIRTTILFIVKPNGFIKAMIDKGAREGQRKNFEALRKSLAQFTPISEAAEGEGLPAAPGAPAAEAAPAEAALAAAAAPAAAAGLLESIVGPAACAALRPWAAWLHAHLDAAAPMLGSLVEPAALLGVLGVLSLLAVLRLVIDMLLFVQNASAHPRDSIGLLTHYLFRLVDVPGSMHEVLLSCAIFYTVRLLVNRLAAALPAPPRARPGGASAAAAAAAPGAAGGAGGGGTDAAAGGARPTRSDTEQESEGVKYEGYAEAIAAAQALPTSPSTSIASEPPAAAGGGGQAAAVGFAMSMKGLSKSISGAFVPARGAPARSSPARGTKPPASPPPATNLPPAQGPLLAGVLAAAPSSSLISPLTSVVSDGDEGPSGAPASPRAAAAPARAGSVPPAGAGAGAASPPAAVPPRSLSDTEALAGGGAHAGGQEEALRRAATGLVHAKSAGALAEESGTSISTFFTGKLRGVLSPSAQPSSPCEMRLRGSQHRGGVASRPTSTDGSTGASPERAFSPTAAQRDFRPAMPAHLAPQLAAAAVIEEVFENQRLQPFRGWGHTWPGHFLPTDKVNHWSRREHDNFPLIAGPEFGAIAPPLPEGWQWCEEAWHIDFSGEIIDACDADGWTYGLDFSYVRHPFQPGSGKKKMSDFVRRRRWLRTRVPLELAAPRITAIAADTTSWSVAEEAAARGAAAGAAEEAAVAAAVATAAVAAEVGVTAPGEAPLMAGLAAAAAAAAAAAEDKPAAAGGVEEPVEAGKGGAPPTAAAPVQQAAAAATGAAKRAAASVATPLGAAAAAPPASLDPGQQGGEHGEVAAVLESIFARVEASSNVQASMQEALMHRCKLSGAGLAAVWVLALLAPGANAGCEIKEGVLHLTAPGGRRGLLAAAAPGPKLPRWAQNLGEVRDSWLQDHEIAKQTVRQLNRQRRRVPDLVQFGDSLTSGFIQGGGAKLWARAFKGLDAVPLGMRGSSVEQLAWRVLRSGELHARAPRLAVFYIGVNNLIRAEKPPAERLEWLLTWAQAAWPDTKLAVVELTPYNWDNARQLGATNRQYRDLAARQGAAVIECGQKVAPNDCTSTWKHAPEDDGWYHAHNALRSDMAALAEMLSRAQAQLAAGKELSAAQRAAATKYFECFLKFMHHHHHNEEEFVMPFMAARCPVPDKVASDHKELLDLLERLEGEMQALLASEATAAEAAARAEAASATLARFRDLCEEHLREEEQELLPLLRKHFTPKEFKPVVDKILRSMDGYATGAFFHPMQPVQRKAFARQEGIPFFIGWILSYQTYKYERNVWQPFQRECLEVTA